MSSAPKVIDLFAGVGGLSLGAERAGFKLSAAVEYEKRIIESHAVNFPNTVHVCADISLLSGKELRKTAELKQSELAGLIGGPPCQGFSTMGKRSPLDQRNQLFIKFYHLITELKPAFFMVENVPGILQSQYDGLRNKSKKLVETEYQVLDPIVISANDLGAVTTRTRVLFVGVRRDVNGADKIVETLENLKAEESASVREALTGLPRKILDDWDDINSSWQKVKTRHFSKYVHYINRFKPGVGDSFSIDRFVERSEVSGCLATKHSKKMIQRLSKLKPGQTDTISKSIKLKGNGLCPTLRAGTDSTRGSFQAVRPIHPYQTRVITPREAARLQGFPDWFQFHETKWHSFRQIGNSVCPIVGEKMLSAIKSSLNM